MLRLINHKGCTDPFINLAVEEYCIGNYQEDCIDFLLYSNTPSVIIGKHQNLFKEINTNSLLDHEINIVRRISGGGSVYHDMGNLNFAFFTSFKHQKLGYYKTLLSPVLSALKHIGISANLNEKNDIYVNAKKISGNAQYTNLKVVLNHGTLLFNADLDALKASLDSNLDIIQSAGVASIQSPVTNVVDQLSFTLSIDGFKQILSEHVLKFFGKYIPIEFSEEQWNVILALANGKYRTWTWNYGNSPEFTVRHVVGILNTPQNVLITVRKGIIRDIKFEGLPAVTKKHRNDIDDLLDKPYHPNQIDKRFGIG